MKRVLILMADFGFGHHSAANALSEALQEIYGQKCVVEIVNPLDDERAPAFLRNEQSDYDRITREMPDLYKLGYKVSDSPVGSNLFESAMTLLLFNRYAVCTEYDLAGQTPCRRGSQDDLKNRCAPRLKWRWLNSKRGSSAYLPWRSGSLKSRPLPCVRLLNSLTVRSSIPFDRIKIPPFSNTTLSRHGIIIFMT